MMNGTKHPFTFKMQVGTTAALTRAPLRAQSQLGAAADYFLIKQGATLTTKVQRLTPHSATLTAARPCSAEREGAVH